MSRSCIYIEMEVPDLAINTLESDILHTSHPSLLLLNFPAVVGVTTNGLDTVMSW